MDKVEEIKNANPGGGPEKAPERKEQGKAPEMQGVKDSVPTSATVPDDTTVGDIAGTLSASPKDDSTVKGHPSTQAPTVKKESSAPYVKKAAKVIEDDKGNPYKEEEDLEDIQIEYLKDRFGKDLKKN